MVALDLAGAVDLGAAVGRAQALATAQDVCLQGARTGEVEADLDVVRGRTEKLRVEGCDQRAGVLDRKLLSDVRTATRRPHLREVVAAHVLDHEVWNEHRNLLKNVER
jgi:hypothetical protein